MKIIDEEVKTFMVSARCDCKKGYLMFVGKFKSAIEKGKMLYMHKCTNCGKMVDLKEKYPSTKYTKI